MLVFLRNISNFKNQNAGTVVTYGLVLIQAQYQTLNNNNACKYNIPQLHPLTFSP